MAVIKGTDVGWIVCHQTLITNIYKETNNFFKFTSYQLISDVFDIRVPFVNPKITKDISKNSYKNEVAIVEKAYSVLYPIFKNLININSENGDLNNECAKSIANSFYCTEINQKDLKFRGGNNSNTPLVSSIGQEMYLIPRNCNFYNNDVKDIGNYIHNEDFDFILLDPPWWNKYVRRKRKKNHKLGYEMLYDKHLKNIPINSLLRKGGLVGIWCTNAPSHIKAILTDLFPAWNLQYIGQWFWLKVTKSGTPICTFSSTCKKQPFERILFGLKKNSCRYYPVPEKNKVIMSVPSAIHSHKPPLVELLKPYLPQESKCLELFARYLLPGWTSYGNEVLKLQHMSVYQEIKSN